MGKKGPPYLDVPSATYIVVEHPWGQTATRNSQGFVDTVGAWVRFMPRTAGDQNPANDILVDTVYTRKNEDYIIVGLPEGTPVVPYLGEHRWRDFLKLPARASDRSLVFEYDYRNNGDPSNHNWTEHYPRADLPPPIFPVRIPYPPPGYAVRPGNLISLTKPMARPVEAVPPPAPTPPVPSFSPPPRQPSPSPPFTRPVVKIEEEDIKPFIKTEDTREVFRVKDEPVDARILPSAYQPSEELLRLAAPYTTTQGRSKERPTVKPEAIDTPLPPDPGVSTRLSPNSISSDDNYRPSGELLRLATSYHKARRKIQEESNNVKAEPVDGQLPPSGSHYQPREELVRLLDAGPHLAQGTTRGVPSSALMPFPSHDPRKRPGCILFFSVIHVVLSPYQCRLQMPYE